MTGARCSRPRPAKAASRFAPPQHIPQLPDQRLGASARADALAPPVETQSVDAVHTSPLVENRADADRARRAGRAHRRPQLEPSDRHRQRQVLRLSPGLQFSERMRGPSRPRSRATGRRHSPDQRSLRAGGPARIRRRPGDGRGPSCDGRHHPRADQRPRSCCHAHRDGDMPGALCTAPDRRRRALELLVEDPAPYGKLADDLFLQSARRRAGLLRGPEGACAAGPTRAGGPT